MTVWWETGHIMAHIAITKLSKWVAIASTVHLD
jgi:hypothetical protein